MTQPKVNFGKLGYLLRFPFPGAEPWASRSWFGLSQSAIDPSLMAAALPASKHSQPSTGTTALTCSTAENCHKLTYQEPHSIKITRHSRPNHAIIYELLWFPPCLLSWVPAGLQLPVITVLQSIIHNGQSCFAPSRCRQKLISDHRIFLQIALPCSSIWLWTIPGHNPKRSSKIMSMHYKAGPHWEQMPHLRQILQFFMSDIILPCILIL